MGGFASLMMGLHHPDRCLSVCSAGTGYGAELDRREKFREEALASATFIRDNGAEAFAHRYMSGPTRIPFLRLNREAFNAFRDTMAGFSAVGLANTQLGVQRERPSLYNLKNELSQYSVPALIVNGDEDWPCLAPGLMLKQVIPTAGLVIYPNCGHTINLERPQELNESLEQLFRQVENGTWPRRDPASMIDSITGMSLTTVHATRSSE
jgi:pimeloyl-ACP methyl ester carboxylesterase